METKCSNIIDKQFLDALRPLISVQNLFLFPKFVITKRRITPLTHKTYTSSFVGAVIFLLMRVYRTIFVMFGVKLLLSTNFQPLIVVNFIIGCIGTVFTYIVNITQSMNAVLMVIELQEATRCLNVRATLFRYKLWNIINIACIFGGYVLFTGLFSITLDHQINTGGSFLVTYVVNIIFDLNIILTTRYVVLIASILEAWNHKMSQVLSEATGDQGNCTKVMFSAYEQIVNAFNFCKNVNQFAIFCHTCEMFYQNLYSMTVFLEFVKPAMHQDLKACYALLRGALYVAWSYKNFTLLVNVSVACERFYASVREVETKSTRAIAAGGHSGVSRMCKNVVRLNGATLRRMTAYNMFTVDAALPLRFVSVSGAYLVVLLQFALL